MEHLKRILRSQREHDIDSPLCIRYGKAGIDLKQSIATLFSLGIQPTAWRKGDKLRQGEPVIKLKTHATIAVTEAYSWHVFNTRYVSAKGWHLSTEKKHLPCALKRRPRGQGREQEGRPSSPLPWGPQQGQREQRGQQEQQQVSRRPERLAQLEQRPARARSWQARQRELRWPERRRAWRVQ